MVLSRTGPRIKMTPSKKDDEMLAEFESLGIEKLFRKFEAI